MEQRVKTPFDRMTTRDEALPNRIITHGDAARNGLAALPYADERADQQVTDQLDKIEADSVFLVKQDESRRRCLQRAVSGVCT